ncbi:MAG: MFS transporter [Ignavibacteriae bacterium]|nr:MFS transporter [Ignavibacteriota bacterium]
MLNDDKKAIFGWAMYDWANSAFATTIMAGFFPIFFKDYWSPDVDATVSTARLGLANSIAGITVALLAPILGAIADKGNSRKRFLILFAYFGALMTMSLFLVSRGEWVTAMLLYVFSIVGFSGANIFYDALLPGVASEKKIDVVSSLGYSLGYLGGGLLFAVNVWMTLSPVTFGLSGPAEAVRLSFLTVGFWWGLFTVPLIALVKEPRYTSRNVSCSEGDKRGGFNVVRAGVLQLVATFKQVRHLKTIFLFLIAYWLYIDGVDTIISMAVAYGKSIGFETKDLITALLITQCVGFPAAIGFGFLGRRISPKRAILIAIGVYLFVSIWGAFMEDKSEFYVLAVIVGLVQGGVQALSRSFYTRIIPVDKSAEFFGFYNMLGKFAVVIGPSLMGTVGVLVRSMGYSSNTASRTSIAAVSLLFVAGGALLMFVNEKKGKEEAAYLSGISGSI